MLCWICAKNVNIALAMTSNFKTEKVLYVALYTRLGISI